MTDELLIWVCGQTRVVDHDLGQWRVPDEGLKLGIAQDDLGSRVLQDVGYLRGSQTSVDGTNDGIGSRDSKVSFEHGRTVGGNDGHTVASFNTQLLLQGIGQCHGSTIQLPVRVASFTMDDGSLGRIDGGAASKEMHRV
jgi:hypothetical protein